MEKLRIGDIEMAYEEHGTAGRPFVLVHGFTGSRDDWREMLPRLGAHGRTLAMDLRGHGDTTNTGDATTYDFAQMARDVVGLLDALGIDRCDLLGHSMGGVVAQLVTLEHPERVASLVLMDTGSEPIRREARAYFVTAGKIAIEAGMETLFGVMRGAAERAAQSPAVARTIERMGPETHWARIRAKVLAMDPIAFATLGMRLTDYPALTSRLGAIQCPTLVLVGVEDAAFLEPSKEMASRIPDARLVVIEDAAHSPQLENPEAWFAAIDAHLKRARTAW
jgi:pimeloyl-ACP methyl ester carboxylesterase